MYVDMLDQGSSYSGHLKFFVLFFYGYGESRYSYTVLNFIAYDVISRLLVTSKHKVARSKIKVIVNIKVSTGRFLRFKPEGTYVYFA